MNQTAHEGPMVSAPARPTHQTSGDRLAELAPRATVTAVATLVLSTIALALFFGGMGGIFGPVNDLLLAASFLLLVPAVVTVGRDPRTPGWQRVLGGFALAGIAVLVVGNLLLVAGLIPLPASFVTVSAGIVAVLGWGVGSGLLALRGRILEPAVGRWVLATAIAFVVAAAGWPILPIGAWSVLGIALFAAFAGWLLALARALGRTLDPAR